MCVYTSWIRAVIFTQGAQWFLSFHEFQSIQSILGLTLQRNQQVKETLSRDSFRQTGAGVGLKW